MVCTALTGAQLAKVLSTELSLPIHQVFLWADSTTVLTWLQSNSCQFKVLVGTRVAEIQDLTEREAWSYVDSTQNPADDITRREKTVGALNTALLVSRPILPLLLIRPVAREAAYYTDQLQGGNMEANCLYPHTHKPKPPGPDPSKSLLRSPRSNSS